MVYLSQLTLWNFITLYCFYQVDICQDKGMHPWGYEVHFTYEAVHTFSMLDYLLS